MKIKLSGTKDNFITQSPTDKLSEIGRFPTTSFDSSCVVGFSPDGEQLFRLGACKRHCVSPDGEIWKLVGDGTEYEKTSYIYVPVIQTYKPRIFVGGVVVDKRLHYIGGNVIKREYINGERYETINGKPFHVVPSSEISRDDAIRFMFEDGDDKDKLSFSDISDDDFFIKYDGFICYFDSRSENIMIDKQFTKTSELSMNDRARLLSDVKDVFEVLASRKLQLYLDIASFVDIEKEDRALCFYEMEKVISRDIGEINLSEMGRTLNLSRSTLAKLKGRSNGETENGKSGQKLFSYKVVYAYLKSTFRTFT